MIHAHEKSDLAIVAAKPANNAERSAAEPVEPRAGTEGNAHQQNMPRAQYRIRRDTRAGAHTASCQGKGARLSMAATRFAVTHPRWEPYARIGPVRICAGGAQQ